jgi:CubicO group peptidase (beta-lactamase class C family)
MLTFFRNRLLNFLKLTPLVFALVSVNCSSEKAEETLAIQAQQTNGLALQSANPEDVGMDPDRLDRVTQAMQEFVDEGLLSGVVTMAARRNKVIHFESVGYRDIESKSPMNNDTIFRIYSMTKPVTGVALMILYEEGKFRLSDPVSKYLPELNNLQVFSGTDEDGNIITEPPDHPMTIRELMSHTGGLTYGIFASSPVDSKYREAELLSSNLTNEEFTRRLGQIPLKHQPGSRWEYSVAVDVQGYLVEKLSGQPFDEFLRNRIFEPLNMVDTGFFVSEKEINRFAQVYSYNDAGELEAGEGFSFSNFLANPKFKSGGHGLVSTANDYIRFSQMLLNGGVLDGIRILAPLTVELMHRDQTPKGMTGAMSGAGGLSFGLDFAIVEDPVEAETYSKGEYYWGGAAGTWFWIDPLEELVFVGMIQQFGALRPDVRSASRRLVYQAITDAYGI